MDPLVVIIIVLVAIAVGVGVGLFLARRRARPEPPARFAPSSMDRTMVGTTDLRVRPPADDRTVVGVEPRSAPPDVTAPTVIVPRPPRARVSISKGGTGGPFDLGPREYRIGRSSGSDIVLADPSVSGQHAKLSPRGDSFVLEDLGSTNGTTVNGQAVTAPRPLRSGDVLGIGDAVLRYELA